MEIIARKESRKKKRKERSREQKRERRRGGGERGRRKKIYDAISLVTIARPGELMISTQLRINSREIVTRFNCCQKCVSIWTWVFARLGQIASTLIRSTGWNSYRTKLVTLFPIPDNFPDNWEERGETSQSNSHFLNRDLLKLNLRNYRRYHRRRLERSSENEEAIERLSKAKQSISLERGRKREREGGEKKLASVSATLCLRSVSAD